MARGVSAFAPCVKTGVCLSYFTISLYLSMCERDEVVPVGPPGGGNSSGLALSLIHLLPFSKLSEMPHLSGYLWDRHWACLRLSSLLPCGSHWKQMVSKQPVMFTAAAIKDKSPTTHSLRRPMGSHRALQTAAGRGGGASVHYSLIHT